MVVSSSSGETSLVTRGPSDDQIGDGNPLGAHRERETAQVRKKIFVYRRRPKILTGGKRGRDEGLEENPELGLGLRFDNIREVRAQELRRLLDSLNSKQREDVKEIGFGGLLDFKCQSLPDQMNDWLITWLDPVSRNFTVDKIRFSLTGLDAKRAFGLNYAPGNPVLYCRRDVAVAPVLEAWKTRYFKSGCDSMDMYEAQSLLRSMAGGGDDFKRLFVLYVMKALLTPKFGAHLELGLLKSLVVVDSIHKLDWAGYVVEHLCDTIYLFSQRPSPRGCEGCLLLLQLTYFHSCLWKGLPPAAEEPLIKHWYSTKLGDRVMEEIRAGGFGKGWFFKTAQVRRGLFSSTPMDMVASSSQTAKEGCPMGMWTSDDISQAIEDEGNRQTWLLLRDVEAVIRSHVGSEHLDRNELRDSCFVPVGIDKVRFNARGGFDRVMNNLFALCWYLNRDMTTKSRCPVEDTLGLADPFGEGSSSDAVAGSPWSTWVFNYPARYVSHVLKRCCTISHCFPPYRLELADFCLSGGSMMDYSDMLFSAGGCCWLLRGQFVTMDFGQLLDPAIVTAFARVLNDEWSRQGITSRVCFGVLHLDDKSVTESDMMKEWKEWINVCNVDVRSAAIVLIPVLWTGKFSLLIINFLDDKVQCIEPAQGGAAEFWYEQRTHVIGSAFSHLLHMVHDDRAEEAAYFAYERITPRWSRRVRETDSGVCVMNMLERFSGSSIALDMLGLDEESKIIQLRVAYSCFIVLSLLNLKRADVLRQTKEFIEMKKVPDSDEV